MNNVHKITCNVIIRNKYSIDTWEILVKGKRYINSIIESNYIF